MGFGDRIKHKYLQSSYKPRKSKPMFGFAKGFLDEIEDYLTPDSEKKKDKKDGGKKS